MKIGIMIFDGVEELDFAGPWEVLTVASKLTEKLDVMALAPKMDPVRCAKGLRVLPDCGFDHTPPLDVLLVPGGEGTRRAESVPGLVGFIRGAAPACRWVTSVCTGALLLHGAGILAGAVDLTHRIRTEFRYDPKATVISTPLNEVFVKRHGVCQDFAHVMIAGLRGLGLPAAYVSGYLRTIPPPGRPRLQGADATHAWVSLWCGEDIGWVGLDPTNDILVENDHIVLAVGRDFSDVSPVDGIIVGSRKQKLAVAVDVLLVE